MKPPGLMKFLSQGLHKDKCYPSSANNLH